jgi:hypothetical protein
MFKKVEIKNKPLSLLLTFLIFKMDKVELRTLCPLWLNLFHFRCFSKNVKIRSYSSAHEVGREKA